MKRAGVLHGQWAATQRRRRTYAETTLLQNREAIEAGKLYPLTLADQRTPEKSSAWGSVSPTFDLKPPRSQETDVDAKVAR